MMRKAQSEVIHLYDSFSAFHLTLLKDRGSVSIVQVLATMAIVDLVPRVRKQISIGWTLTGITVISPRQTIVARYEQLIHPRCKDRWRWMSWAPSA
jgi:hypothetical protein